MRIELLDLVTAAESDLRNWYGCRIAAARVDSPDDPDLPFDLVRGQLEPDGLQRRRTWVCRGAAGDVLGGVRLALPDDENQHTCDSVVTVHPDARRRGVGRALLERAAGEARAEGRRSMTGTAQAGSPGAAFATRMGAVRKQADTRSLLRVAHLDPTVIASWAAGEASQTSGYTLARWRLRCPEELVESYSRALAAMNDAPLGALDCLPVRFHPERVRRYEAARAVRGQRLRVVCAQETSTGEIAGLTELFVRSAGPRAEQGGTAVPAAHRGRGLGLWVKANMLTWLLADHPGVTEVETRNATDNLHMRRVNTRLGYVAIEEWLNYQMSLDLADNRSR